ncbi:16006_t:CDS:2 [Funneliformis mosseae]|uniref:16006_t:CDS:1 n=1 Tax=Funneliformis mosseae TaxID=27381 RepID=A0A9N8VCB8_FUNMO|nr:16006_t:CDS:2 [Funneliformis mosseae]
MDQIGSRDGEKPRKPEEKTPPSPKEPKEEKSTANHLKTGHFPDVILCIITMICDLQSDNGLGFPDLLIVNCL